MIAVPIEWDRRYRLPAGAVRHMRPWLAVGTIERGLAESDRAEAEPTRKLLFDHVLVGPPIDAFERGAYQLVNAER